MSQCELATELQTNIERQGCSLGLERLGLEAVSRRFLERLVSSQSREFGKIERLGLGLVTLVL